MVKTIPSMLAAIPLFNTLRVGHVRRRPYGVEYVPGLVIIEAIQ